MARSSLNTTTYKWSIVCFISASSTTALSAVFWCALLSPTTPVLDENFPSPCPSLYLYVPETLLRSSGQLINVCVFWWLLADENNPLTPTLKKLHHTLCCWHTYPVVKLILTRVLFTLGACARALKRTLLRLLGAQGASVFSAINLAHAILLTISWEAMWKKCGN